MADIQKLNPAIKRQGTYIIAEIGTSHQGDRQQLADLIAAAAASGADCAKFQWVIADEIIHANTGIVHLPTGSIRLYDRFKALECSIEFYAEAQSLCQKANIDFLCTPFGHESAKGLFTLDVPSFKIASPELNHLPLVKQLAEYHRELIVSSGVSCLSDIDETLSLIRNTWANVSPNPNLTLLHCITAYPAPEEEFNILLIRTLADIFGVPTGLSDHSLDEIIVPVLSVLLGGTIVEKHFTLSRTTDGLDDPIALEPESFSRMSQALRTIEQYGEVEAMKAVRDPNSIAKNASRILHDLDKPIAVERLKTILGTGIKRLAKSEIANYGLTNRSIHVLNNLPAGHKLNTNDLAILRTEKILRPGLHPRYLPILIGRVLCTSIEAGQGIRWQDLA